MNICNCDWYSITTNKIAVKLYYIIHIFYVYINKYICKKTMILIIFQSYYHKKKQYGVTKKSVFQVSYIFWTHPMIGGQSRHLLLKHLSNHRPTKLLWYVIYMSELKWYENSSTFINKVKTVLDFLKKYFCLATILAYIW